MVFTKEWILPKLRIHRSEETAKQSLPTPKKTKSEGSRRNTKGGAKKTTKPGKAGKKKSKKRKSTADSYPATRVE